MALMVTPERLTITRILDGSPPSRFFNEVNVISPELVLRDFVVRLRSVGIPGNLWREDGLRSIHHEERGLTSGSAC